MLSACLCCQSVRLNVMRSLATELQTHSKTFRTAQKDFLKRRNKQRSTAQQPHLLLCGPLPPSLPPSSLHRLTRVACLLCVSSELREQESSGSSFSFGGEDTDSKAVLADEDAMDRGFSHEQEQALEEMNERASEREKEIIKVAQSINELAQLFKELNVLVIEQGTILDRIDYNIEQTSVKVKQGVQELEKADEYSKKSNQHSTAQHCTTTSRVALSTEHPKAVPASPVCCACVLCLCEQDVHVEVHSVSAAAHHYSHSGAGGDEGVEEQR